MMEKQVLTVTQALPVLELIEDRSDVLTAFLYESVVHNDPVSPNPMRQEPLFSRTKITE